MSSPSADANPADPTPIPAPGRARRVSHLRAVQSPVEQAPGTVDTTAPSGARSGTAPALAPAQPRGANSAYVAVLLIVGAGVGSTAIEPSHWLRGVLVIGAGVAIGALARALLPARYVGLLAVRSRPFDVICLGALAVLIVTVGFLIPH